MKRISYKKQIDKIMNEFEFRRVHRCMTATNWTWQNKGVPTIEQLKECALELLQDCRRKRDCSLATGGFIVSCDGSYLTLTFYIEQAHGFDEQ